MAPPPRRSDLPTGTVTFLFTDIEGSTRLVSQLGEGFDEVLAIHDRIMREAIGASGGIEVNTEGDAFFAVFTTAPAAVDAVSQAQRDLAAETWPSGVSVRARMGLHSGEGRLGGDNYIGVDVNRAARISAAGHGGQVLISEATRALLAGDSIELRDLGSHELKDLDEPERLCQLVIPGLPASFPPPRAKRRGNLPQPTTPFIGREDVIGDVEALLRDARLVTITGPGGVGKTRIALEAANDFAAALPDGAWFIGLDTLRETELLPATIATGLGLAATEDEPMDILKRHLKDAELLLLLDNLEQLANAGEVVDELMQAAPRLRVLATSQSPLGLYGEHEFPAPALRTPDSSTPLELDRILEHESVALFVARARAAKPSFRVDERNATTVVELVVRLDGLPLAIELAAARIKLLTPKAMLDRLEKRLDLLSSSARNIPERQRTLRGAIDWSYGLLEPTEQHVFDRIGVFAGGFDFETAELVADPDSELDADLLDALGSLVEKSLVRQEEQDDLPRFDQLESIRQYALDRLAGRGEADTVQRRLAEHIAGLAVEAEPFLDRKDDRGWFARLVVELDNIRAGLRWTTAANDARLAQRIVGPIWRLWVRHGLIIEGSWWTDQVLAMTDEPSAARAKALLARGSLSYWQTDYDGAEAPYASALEMYRDLGDEAGVADASYDLAYALQYKRSPDRVAARAAFESALAGFRQTGNAAMTQSTLFAVGWMHKEAGELESAERFFLETLEMDAGDIRPRTGLASVSYTRGDFAAARRWLDECVREAKGMPDLAFAIVLLDAYTAVEVANGNPTLAMELHGASVALREEIGGGPPRDRAFTDDPVALTGDAIGNAAVDAAIERGKGLDARTALDLALSGPAVPRD